MPLKVSEMIKIVEADGWYLDRVTGSHRQFRTLPSRARP
jgi:predicted RNA binding protein YcfA (HicA-like mRNA interferase family)